MSANRFWQRRSFAVSFSRVRLGRRITASAAIALAVGCVDYKPVKEGLGLADARDARHLGEAMDDAARALEEYGTMSVSSPLLAPASMNSDDKNTKFTLDADANRYFNDAREEVQGRAARFEQTSQITRTDLEAQIDVDAGLSSLTALRRFRADDASFREKQSLQQDAARIEYDQAMATAAKEKDPAKRATLEAAAKRAYADKITSATAPPTFPTAAAQTAAKMSTAADTKTDAKTDPDTGTKPDAKPDAKPDESAKPPAADEKPEAAQKAASAAFASAAMKEFGELLKHPEGADVKLTNRAAINIAAGDVASESIFALLSDPQSKAKDFSDKRLLFGVSMVSVEPGWRSKENFAADVSLKVGYQYRPARRELLEAMIDELGVTAPAASAKKIGATTKQADPMLGLIKEALEQIEKDPTTRPSGESNGDPKGHASSFLQMQSATGDFGSGSRIFAASGFATGVRTPAYQVPARYRLPTQHPSPLVAAVSPMTDSEVLDAAAGARQQRERALALAVAVSAFGQKGAAKVFNDYANRIEQDVATRGAMNAITAYSHSGSLFGFQVGPRLRAEALSRKRGSVLGTMTLERQSFPVLVIIGMDADDLGVRFAYVDGVFTAFEPVLTFDQSFRWLPLSKQTAKDRSAFTAGHGDDDVESIRLVHAAGLMAARRALPPTPAELNDQLQSLAELRYSSSDMLLNQIPSFTADAKPDQIMTEARIRLARLRSLRLVLDGLRTRGPVQFTSASSEARRAVRDAAKALTPALWEQTTSWFREAELVQQARLTTGDGKATPPGSNIHSSECPTRALVVRLIDTAIDATYSMGIAAGGEMPAFVRGRMDMLMFAGYGSSNEQAIPVAMFKTPESKEESPKPSLAAIGAISASPTDVTQLVLTGEHLAADDKPAFATVKLVPVDTSTATTRPAPPVAKVELVSDSSLLVTITPTAGTANSPGQSFDLVALGKKKQEVPLGRITFDAVTPAADPGIDVLRDSEGRPTGVRIINFTGSPGLPMNQLLPWLHDLTREGGGGSFDVKLHGPGGIDLSASGSATTQPTPP